MPFKSAAQRRYLYAKEPEVAEEFARKEKEARMTPSSFSKPADKPVGTTQSTTSANSGQTTPQYKKKKMPVRSSSLVRAAQRRMKPNGNSSSSTGSRY